MNKKTMTLTILLVTTLLAGTALAHRYGGGMMGGYADDDSGYCDRYGVDREEVRAVTGKYDGQFATLQKKMEAKRDEMQKARANDATTMGQMNVLRDEMFAIKKEYRALKQKVADELGEKFGDDGDRQGWMMGHHQRGGMMGGRHHDDDDDWGRGYGGCR